MPSVTAGLNLSGNYKGFDMLIFFQGAFGQKVFSQVNYDIEGYYRGFNVTERYYLEHWTGEGTSNTQPRASWAAKSNNVRASLHCSIWQPMKHVVGCWKFLHLSNVPDSIFQ